MKLSDNWLTEMKKRGWKANDPVGQKGRLSPLQPEISVKRKAARRGVPNATEREWGDRLKADGHAAHFEAVTLLLAPGAKYTPDWFYVTANGPCFDEVKGGFVREASMVRLKVAAALFPEFRFRLCQKVRGEWTVREVPSG